MSKLNAEAVKKEKDGYDVLADIYRYSEAGDYGAIETGDLEIRFKWFGIYRQKPNTGHFMIRIRIPGGQLSPHQLRVISELCDKYARGFADITTRQTIQFHWLTIKDLGPVCRKLHEIGLNSTFACGDTPRNIVSCPLAGVLKDEIIDSTPELMAVNAAFVDGAKEFSNLPRKFKSAVGGCNIHCHQPQINCLSFYGVKRPNGEVGYGLMAGGGLSDTPYYAQSLRVFLKPSQVVDAAKGVAKVFRDHGYREKRGRARLKFLVADKGWQWIRDRVEEYAGYQFEHDDSIVNPRAVHSDHMGVGEQKDGHFYVGIPIERGRFTAQNMRDLADLADKHAAGDRRIRLTGKQNIILLDVPKANVDKLTFELNEFGLPPVAHRLRDLLVSCTGSEFCNLAVAETKHRAGAVLRWLEKNVELDSPVMISFTGCPNACGQFQIADIGLRGTGMIHPTRKDENGKSLKCEGFSVALGATLGETPKFGEFIVKKVPSDLVHLSIKNLLETYKSERTDEDETFFQWTSRSTPEYLSTLILAPTEAPSAEPLLV